MIISLMSLIVLVAIASTSISSLIVDSELKRFALLDKRYPVLELLSVLKSYKKILGSRLTSLLLPVILPLIVLVNIHRLLYSLFNCEYCLAFWLAVIITTTLHFNFILVVLVGGLAIFAQTINNLIRSYMK